jgi:transcriptional accessory protein Tex/SPT6
MTPDSSARKTAAPPQRIPRRVASELGLDPKQVSGALALFAGGATLPFIARYRKEATGGLDEVQLRDVHERAHYMEALDVIIFAFL